MRRYAAMLIVAAMWMMCFAGMAHAEAPGKGKDRAGHGMGASVHHSVYMQLLAEKYAPKTVDDWEKALEERSELLQRLHEMRGSKKWDSDTARQKIKQFGEKNREAFHEYRVQAEQLTKALEAKDEEAIRKTLPRLLKAEQKLNETLRQWLDREQKDKNQK